MQHIITQDFARNQDPPPVSSSASATFQGVVPPVSSSGRAKVPSRYSPESQVQAPHHQRPSSRVSPENVPDKPRARYMTQPLNFEIIRVGGINCSSSVQHFSLSALRPGLVNLQSEVAGRWKTMNPSHHHRATKVWTNKTLAGLQPRGERLRLRSGMRSPQFECIIL